MPKYYIQNCYTLYHTDVFEAADDQDAARIIEALQDSRSYDEMLLMSFSRKAHEEIDVNKTTQFMDWVEDGHADDDSIISFDPKKYIATEQTSRDPEQEQTEHILPPEVLATVYQYGILEFGVGYEKEPTCIIGDVWFYFTGTDKYTTFEEYVGGVGDKNAWEQIASVIDEFDIEDVFYITGYIAERVNVATYKSLYPGFYESVFDSVCQYLDEAVSLIPSVGLYIPEEITDSLFNQASFRTAFLEPIRLKGPEGMRALLPYAVLQTMGTCTPDPCLENFDAHEATRDVKWFPDFDADFSDYFTKDFGDGFCATVSIPRVEEVLEQYSEHKPNIPYLTVFDSDGWPIQDDACYERPVSKCLPDDLFDWADSQARQVIEDYKQLNTQTPGTRPGLRR